MHLVLGDPEIPEDAGVGIEFQIPQTATCLVARSQIAADFNPSILKTDSSNRSSGEARGRKAAGLS